MVKSVSVSSELTQRERQVMALIASGNTSKEIARQLNISFKTATCHRTSIMAKIGARNTADTTRAAIRLGLVEA